MALLSDVLQRALFARLSGDAAVTAVLGAHVYDAVPAGPVPELFALIGEDRVRDASDASGAGAVHEVTVSVLGAGEGFLRIKEAAVAVEAAVMAPGLILERGAVRGSWFLGARARRVSGGQRRMDLRFRLRLEA